jgi:AP-1-like factor
LKDLETKVEELEKASEAANHENSMLRAQVERITAELGHYKQRMTLVSPKASTQARAQPFGNAAVSNINDVSFQFEFPKFGTLPGPPAKAHQKSMSQPISPSSHQSSSPAASQNNNNNNIDKVSHFTQQAAARTAQFKEDLAKFNNNNNNGAFNMHTPSMSSSTATGSRASVDSANYSANNTTSSPSASSHSNVGASSSCGTSPEPFTQSPMGFKPVDTLTTIGEEHPSMSTSDGPFSQFTGLDFNNNSFDWLVQQNNGGQFDPQLFGDYREPQESVMTHSTFDDLFNDSLEADFFTPYNIANSPNHPKKMNLIDEIDAKQNSIDDDPSNKSNMSCNQLWYVAIFLVICKCVTHLLTCFVKGKGFKHAPKRRMASST